jgi:hypothetical protein
MVTQLFCAKLMPGSLSVVAGVNVGDFVKVGAGTTVEFNARTGVRTVVGGACGEVQLVNNSTTAMK